MSKRSENNVPTAPAAPIRSKNLPKIVIVGRPNVGKSTLFNRLIGRRVAVVQHKPGITRDRLYHECEWQGVKFELIDTGGILFFDEDPLIEQIRLQANVAVEEADVVVFMADAVDGVTPADQELADELRGAGKPIIVAVNKADNATRDTWATDFYALGIGDVFPVSALHGRGVADVLDKAVEAFPESAPAEEVEDHRVRIAIIGRPNVGKSSLLNAFTGEKRAIVSDIPGTTRDAVDTEITYKGDKIILVDTAGLRRRGKVQGTVEYYMALRATRAMERAQLALVVVDGYEGLTDGDKRIAKSAHLAHKACVFGVNKWDMVEPPDGRPRQRSLPKKEFAQILRDEFPELSYAPIAYTSATHSTGLEAALETCNEALESYNFRISTASLNTILRDAVYERPYSSKGKPFRVYYATQTSTAPPCFLIFCNDPKRVHFSYARYLENSIRKAYPMEGTPIFLKFKSSHERDQH
ncbi:MAG: ribosome biogenesis GTPase Der [Fimbriimonadales bacterium]